MFLQFERHFSIAHDSIFGGILSSPTLVAARRSLDLEAVVLKIIPFLKWEEIVLNVEAKRVTWVNEWRFRS